MDTYVALYAYAGLLIVGVYCLAWYLYNALEHRYKIDPYSDLGHKILQVFNRKNIRLLKETPSAIVVHFKGGMQFSVHATTEGLKSLGTMLSVIGLALHEVGYDKASVYWQDKSVVVDFGDGENFTLTCEFDGDGKPWLDGRG